MMERVRLLKARQDRPSGRSMGHRWRCAHGPLPRVGAMNGSSGVRERRFRPGWAAALCLAFGLSGFGDVAARDRNPWAVPDPRVPAPTLQPPADARFAPPDYDPVNDRRGRAPRPGEFVPPEMPSPWEYPHSGWSPGSDRSGLGLYDPTTTLLPWSGLYGIPGFSGYPGLSPYGVLPGSGILWPGTGLTTPGLAAPWYGLGTAPLLGLPY